MNNIALMSTKAFRLFLFSLAFEKTTNGIDCTVNRTNDDDLNWTTDRARFLITVLIVCRWITYVLCVGVSH